MIRIDTIVIQADLDKLLYSLFAPHGLCNTHNCIVFGGAFWMPFQDQAKQQSSEFYRVLSWQNRDRGENAMFCRIGTFRLFIAHVSYLHIRFGVGHSTPQRQESALRLPNETSSTLRCGVKFKPNFQTRECLYG